MPEGKTRRLHVACFATFRTLAHWAFWAAAILARASALSVGFVLALLGKLVAACRLGFRFSVALVQANSAFTCRA
jgi:hypothetical protein